MSIFDQAIALTFHQEGDGELSMDPHDPGNWTGGEVGKGELRGSRFGVSAASYPTVDIGSLTRDAARRIALVDRWAPLHCELMPPALAVLAFDFAYQSGVGNATRALQALLGVTVDGDFGPRTAQTLRAQTLRVEPPVWDIADACAQFQMRRIVFLTRLAEWGRYEADWSRRVCALLIAAAQLIPAAVPAADPAATPTPRT